MTRVEWVPSSPDVLEVRVFGMWRGTTVPPEPVLAVGDAVAISIPGAVDPGAPPAWGAAFHAPVEVRAALEAGDGRLLIGDEVVDLPGAGPGVIVEPADDPGGTLVDHGVLAERRARRAELAEQSAAQRAASAEQAAETLRAQLEQLEERLARAGAERDGLAARVADAERQLRLAEQREEAERRRRNEVEEEVAEARRAAEDELEQLRDRLAGAEEVAAVLERELAAARRRANEADEARRRAETALRDLRGRLDALEAGATTSAADEETLRALAADIEALRTEAEALRDRAAEAETLRARLAEAESAQVDPVLVETLRSRIGELERELVAERIARAAAERKAATPVISDRERALAAEVAELSERIAALPVSSERIAELEAQLAHRSARIDELQASLDARVDPGRERELATRVGELQAELERRVVTQQRVQDAIAAVRTELDGLRSRVHGDHAGTEALRRELDSLDARRRSLETVIHTRDAELGEVRSALESARTAAEAARSDVDDLREAAAKAQRAADDLQVRLDEERRLREAAERALAEARTPDAPEDRLTRMTDEVTSPRARLQETATATPPPPPSAAAPGEEDALDALLTGLRAQVAAARDQLDALEDEDAGDRSARERLEQEVTSAAIRPPAGEPTHEGLQAIEDELRAAVPASGAATAPDMIASLQHAADRLRAAAQEELARSADEPRAPREEAPRETVGEAGPRPAAPLTPRALASRTEGPWLRTALVRLAERDERSAAELFIALLPAQASAIDRLSYDITTPQTERLRVTLAGGGARIERPSRTAPKADAALVGSLSAAAPLAAGGVGWLLRDVKIRHGWLKVRRLIRARRQPVALMTALQAGSPLGPGLLLTALAAAVDARWTGGHRFAVDYAVDGEGVWTVAAHDGRPLAVARRDTGDGDGDAIGEASALVALSADAVVAVLTGTRLPDGATAEVSGDRRAVDMLHAWFDGARGVAER